MANSEGNNPLHLAAKSASLDKLNRVAGAALQMQRELQWYKEVEKLVRPRYRNLKNKRGQTHQTIFTEKHQELKDKGEQWMKGIAASCAIVAALIITVMFAAAITVPGGNESSTGFPLFSRDMSFVVFATADAVSVFTSATSLLVFLSILTSRFAEERFLFVQPTRSLLGLGNLFLSITSTMVAFSAAIFLVLGRKKTWILIPTSALSCLAVAWFVVLQFPLLSALLVATCCPGIFGKKSDKPFL